MWSFASSLFQKVVHFSPIKTIFQQLFQKFSKDFLQTQPQLSFKDGVLQLDKLRLSSTKINQTFLIGSPYVLHYGCINNIRINLPGNESKGNKNIEIKVDGIQLVMEPNQHFKDTFEENIKHIKKDSFGMQQFPTQPANNSLSFFKRMIQEFFTNMKIDILNISIKWFMNKPFKNVQHKPQYYLMLRVPKIGVERVNDMQVGKIHQDFMKYRTQIPQISIHLLKQDIKAPEFSNFKARMEDIPNYYPTVTHPSTIFLMGRQSDIGKQKISIVFRISKNIKNKSKQLSIVVEDTPNLEFMIEPVQLIVIGKFIEQIQTFKRVYNSVIQKIKAESAPFNRSIDESRDFDIVHQPDMERSSLKSADVNKSLDLFSSFAISIEHMGGKTSKQPSYFATIFENNKEMEVELEKLEKQMEKEAKKQDIFEHTEQFKSITVFKINLKLIRVYILKHSTSTELFEYERIWSIDEENVNSLLNISIPSSYIMLSLNQLMLSFQTNISTTIKFKQLSLLDVQLKTTVNLPKKQSVSKKTIEASSNVNESMDVFQSCTGISVQDDGLKELLRYEINPQYSHYCSTTIFSISNKPDAAKTFQTPIYKHTNFYSALKNSVLKDKQFGFVLSIKKQQKLIIDCNIYCISLLIDDNFLHDLLMIIRPVLTYKYLANTKTDLSPCDAQLEKKTNKILNHSIYDFHEQVGLQQMPSLRGRSSTAESQHGKKSTKPEFNLEIEQIHIVAQLFKNIPSDLIKHYKSCSYDPQLFDHECYCNKHTQGIDLQVQSVTFKKCTNTKINLMELGLRLVKNKQKLQTQDIVHLGKQGGSYPKISIQTTVTQTIIKKQVITIRLPKFALVVQKNTPKQLLTFVETLKQKGEQLRQLNRYLKEQLCKYSPKHTNPLKINPKVSKASQIFNIYVERLGLQFLEYELLVKHVLVNFQQNLVIAKIFEGLLAKTHQPHLKLQNPWKSSQFAYYHDDSHQAKFKKYGIRSGIDRIVAHIEKTMEFPLQGQLKQKEYFEVLFRLPVPVEVNLLFQDQKYKPNQQKAYKAPNFSKAPKADAKLRSKVIDIIVRVPIFVKGIELKEFKYVKVYFDEIKNMFKHSQILNPPNKPRRPSEDQIIPPETLQQKLVLKAIAQSIHIDMFPYVQCTKQQEILSHTRSMIEIQDLEVGFNQKQTLDCKIKVEKVKIKWKLISLYFLTFFDAHLDLNKEIIPFDQIESYGFRRMLDLKGDLQFTEIKTHDRGKQVEIAANVYELDTTFSSHTIGHLDDHIKHILQNLKDAMKKLNKNGVQQNSNHQKKEQKQDQQQSSAEDFDQIDQKIQQIENNRLKQQSQFRSDPIRLTQRSNNQLLTLRLNIKQIDIRRICIKITDKPDYNFINYIPRGEDVPLVIELDEKLEVSEDLFIEKHQINKFRRFRTTQKSEGKVLRILVENALLYMEKYENKVDQKQLNLCLVVNLKALECNLYVPEEEQTFSILKTIDRFQILVDVDGSKTRIKTAGRRLELGFSSTLNFLKNDIKATNKKRKQSIFSVDDDAKVLSDQSSPTKLMLFIPQMSIVLNLQLVGWKFISNQHLTIPSLLFHNVLSKYMEEDNKEFVKQWIKNILTDNLGKLLGNGFTNLVSNSLIGLLICLKQIVLLPSHAIGMFKSS